MTFNELVERAKRQLNAGQPQPHVWPDSEIDLAACVMQARQRAARKVMNDDRLRGLLQQEYPVTLSAAGVGDLLTAVGSVTATAGEILLEGVHFGLVVDGDGNVLKPLTHLVSFTSPQDTNFAYYLLKNDGKIATRAKDIPVILPSDVV